MANTTPETAAPAPETFSREITTQNPEGLIAYVAKLNKRAAKLGVAPLVATKTGETMGEQIIVDEDVRIEHGAKIAVQITTFTIEGKLPQLNGWEFAASVEPTPTGDDAILWGTGSKTIPAFPECYRHMGHVCEHCNTKRKRAKTYLLYRASDSAWKQVGSDCLKDFLGGLKDPAAIFEFLSIIVLGGFDEESMGGKGGSSAVHVYDTKGILKIAARLVLAQGYIKTEKNWDGEITNYPTTHRVHDILNPPKNFSETRYGGRISLREVWENCKATVSDEQVDTLLAEYDTFVKALTGKDDYERNIVAAYGSELASRRSVSLLTSSVGFMLGRKRFEERQAEQAKEKAAAGPAPTGRVAVEGTVVSMKEVTGDFGTTLKMIVRLTNGSRVYVTAPGNIPIDVNTKLKFTATFEVSQKDSTFAFGKRPSKASVITETQPELAPAS